MVSRKHYYHSIQRQSRCKDHNYVLDTIRAAGMDETYDTYVDDESFDIHDYDDDTDDDADDDDDEDTDDAAEDDTNGDTDDDADDGGAGTEGHSREDRNSGHVIVYDKTLILDLGLSRNRL